MYIIVAIFFIIAVYFAIKYYMLRKDIATLDESMRFRNAISSNQRVGASYQCSELHKLADTLQKMLDECDDRCAEYSKELSEYEVMVTNITHDLRTPLTSAIGNLKLMDKGDERVAVVRSKLVRLAQTIEKLYELSKSISEKAEPQFADVDLQELIFSELSSYYDEFEKLGLQMSVDISGDDFVVLSDEQSLRVIVRNLIDNVYLHGKDFCEVKLFKRGSRVVFSISNAWDVVEIKNDIFARGVTLSSSRTKGSTGLGLSIIELRANSIGAKINYKADDIFTIEIEI